MSEKKEIFMIILKIISIIFCISILLTMIIGVLLSIPEIIKEEKNKNKIKCVQNELFSQESEIYKKQNKKCSIIENKIYIYENGDLVKAY